MRVEMTAVFFDDWAGLLRIVVVGLAAYAALVAMLRASGKPALAKLNAFDLIVTIALGSVLATVLLSATVTLAEGLTAMAMLLGMQYAVARASTRSRRVERLVSSEPTLVYRNGFLHEAMRAERVTADELRQVARAQGHPDLDEVGAIVLESDGTLSILDRAPTAGRLSQ